MLKPKDMVRVLIVGPMDLLPRTIDILYDLQILHIVDFREEDETFTLGRPLEKASEVSESLLKLRSISSVLELGKVKGLEVTEVGPDAQQRLLTLEINIHEEDEARKRVEELLMDLNARIEAMAPFAALGLDLSYYSGYENLGVFVGRLHHELVGLEEVTDSFEVVRSGDSIALFVEASRAGEVRTLLSRLGFVPLEVPGEKGDPKAMLGELLGERAKWQARLKEVQGRLATLRERFAGFVVSAEDFLTKEIEKAEAPLRFATSDHSFIAEGWIPEDRWEEVQSRLEGLGSLYVGTLEESEEDPPVLLDNPKPVKPFEFLTKLFSTPGYKEIDPTIVLFLIFPIFFGFMIGDLGYGTLWVVLGLLAVKKMKPPSDLRTVMAILLIGGIVSMFFGAFVFAEAFGIPFAAAKGDHSSEEAITWSGLLGVDIHYEAQLHKLTDIGDMLILSLLAGVIHLGLGFMIGFFNEFRHNRKHALAKVAWLMVLLGLFIAITAQVRWNRIAGFVWGTVLAPVPLEGPEFVEAMIGLQMPWTSFALLIAGAIMLVAFENPIAIIEIAGLLANMISYTRLAGIGVAKAAIAEALNNSIFHGLILTPNIGFAVLGFVLLVLAQMLVFFLGAISSGIQALRLNYVEFFVKFFKGNGVPFRPFGARAGEAT